MFFIVSCHTHTHLSIYLLLAEVESIVAARRDYEGQVSLQPSGWVLCPHTVTNNVGWSRFLNKYCENDHMMRATSLLTLQHFDEDKYVFESFNNDKTFFFSF